MESWSQTFCSLTLVCSVAYKAGHHDLKKLANGYEFNIYGTCGVELFESSLVLCCCNCANAAMKYLAKKEVILCAGAVCSPWLLLLSGPPFPVLNVRGSSPLLLHAGVGPKEHLESMDIPVVADVQGVGRNLQVLLIEFSKSCFYISLFSFRIT